MKTPYRRNEKHFAVRMPAKDFEVLERLAESQRSTVAQQVRQAIANYVEANQPKEGKA